MSRSETLRIIDANLNRAREALRVVEEHARFVLDDAELATALKALRHELRQLAGHWTSDELLAARDILGDVGRETKTAAELERHDAGQVAAAALSRLGEALRVIEEYAKLDQPEAARLAERLRYQSYELTQRAVLRAEPRRRFRNTGLYVIVSERACRGPWRQVARAALAGGAGCLQLREKELPDAELLRRARWLRGLTREHDALLIINDRPDVALLSGADGVHVGQDDLPVAQVRRVAGARLLVGKSTHTPAQFDAALAEGPDYVAVGPMFASGTKPQVAVAGTELLAGALKRTALPVVAIGGIDAENVDVLLRLGAQHVCVCAAVVAAADAQRAARQLVERLAAARADDGGRQA